MGCQLFHWQWKHDTGQIDIVNIMTADDTTTPGTRALSGGLSVYTSYYYYVYIINNLVANKVTAN